MIPAMVIKQQQQGRSPSATVLLTVSVKGAGHESAQQMQLSEGDEVVIHAGYQEIIAGTVRRSVNGALCIERRGS